MSLARLLDAQPGAHVTHEKAPPLSWEPSPERTKAIKTHALDFFEQLLLDKTLVGDVSLWWLQSLEDLREFFPHVKVVALRRNREETITSWIKQEGGKQYIEEAVGKIFPDFFAHEREAIGQFYDDYYAEVARRGYALFPIESLNSEKGQDEIFEFLKLDDHVHLPVHYHAHGKWSTRNQREELIV